MATDVMIRCRISAEAYQRILAAAGHPPGIIEHAKMRGGKSIVCMHFPISQQAHRVLQKKSRAAEPPANLAQPSPRSSKKPS